MLGKRTSWGRRAGLAIATSALAVAALVGVAACGDLGSATSSAADSGTVMLSPDQTALTALGFSDDDVTTTGTPSGLTAADGATAAPTTSKAPGARGGKAARPRVVRLAIRRSLLRGHLEHGSITVETAKGDQTIDVQRGTITSLNDTTMTVKSTDGYTLTWTITGPLTVIERGTRIQPGQIKVGDQVGVAGTGTSNPMARLVVVPKTS